MISRVCAIQKPIASKHPINIIVVVVIIVVDVVLVVSGEPPETPRFSLFFHPSLYHIHPEYRLDTFMFRPNLYGYVCVYIVSHVSKNPPLPCEESGDGFEPRRVELSF